MKKYASISIRLPSVECANGVLNALKPETASTPIDKYAISISVKDNIICMDFEASTTQNLRSAINSYLRWVIAIQSVYRVIK